MRNLFLFTSRFPGGKAESFIEPELNLLAKYFEKIHILPLLPSDNIIERKLPVNVEIHDPYEIQPVKIQRIKLVFIKIFISEFLNSKKKMIFIKNWKYNLIQLIQCWERSKNVESKLINEIQDSVYYTFWMEDWATTLSFIKKRNPKFSFISRVHGYDLFEERSKLKFIPWRNFQLKYVSRVVAVARVGENYLSQNYPFYKNKYAVSYLGVNNHDYLNNFKGEEIVFVSCSNLIPLKRVDLLANLIAKLKMKVRWVHFGDGEEMEKIRNLVRSENYNSCTVELRGQVSPSEITDYYKENPVSLFIHLSLSEGGVPLVIQEAISFGIPVLACKAGGVNEIVNENTGIIIDIDFTEEEFFEAIQYILKNCSGNEAFRKDVKNYWKKTFQIEQSMDKFLSILEATYNVKMSQRTNNG